MVTFKPCETLDPVAAPGVNTDRNHQSYPEFIRLPPPGLRCAYTGLSRSALNQLVLPCPQNDGHPPVKSFCLRQRGAKTGIRLIDYASLAAHIRANVDQAA